MPEVLYSKYRKFFNISGTFCTNRVGWRVGIAEPSGPRVVGGVHVLVQRRHGRVLVILNNSVFMYVCILDTHINGQESNISL